MEKLCRKCAPKASPRPLFNFGKRPKTPIMRLCMKLFYKIKYFEKGPSKILKKLTLIFLLNLVFFNGQN